MAGRYLTRGSGVPRFVVVLHWRGRRLIWTSDGQPVDGLTGTVVGAVELGEIEDRIDLDGSDVRERISVDLPWLEDTAPRDMVDREVDVALVTSSGGWAGRFVVLNGVVTVAEYERAGTLVAMEFESVDVAASEWPPATYVVEDRTFPTTTVNPLQIFPPFFQQRIGADKYTLSIGPDPASLGHGYPVPYGITGVDRPVMPVAIVDRHANSNTSLANELLVAAGDLREATVEVWAVVDGAADTGSARFEARAQRDTLGQTVWVVEIHTESNTYRASKDWFASFDGKASPTVTAGAGHVAQWVLSQTGAIDLLWSGEAVARSSMLEIGGYIDEPMRPLDWFEDRIAGVLPLATGRAPSGRVRLVWVPYTGGEVMASMTDGVGGVLRAGPIEEIGKAEATAFEVRFAHHAQRDEYMRSITFANGPMTPSSPTEVIEADDIHNETTAAVAAQYAVWRSRYRREVSLDVPTSDWAWLVPGMVVRYTDDEMGLSGEAHIVLSVTRTDRPMMAVRLTPIKAQIR